MRVFTGNPDESHREAPQMMTTGCLSTHCQSAWGKVEQDHCERLLGRKNVGTWGVGCTAYHSSSNALQGVQGSQVRCPTHSPDMQISPIQAPGRWRAEVDSLLVKRLSVIRPFLMRGDKTRA